MLPDCNIVTQHRPHREQKFNFTSHERWNENFGKYAPERPWNAPFTPVTPEAAR
jgi:hypothetical protein